MKWRASLLFISLIGATTNSMAASSTQTKHQLNQLEERIQAIKQQLRQDTSTRTKIYQKLARAEKQMGEDLHALHTLKQDEKQKKAAIEETQRAIEALNEKLKTQQVALQNHLRARHRLGVIHPWQWLLHQESSRHLSRLFTFYDYLFRADRALIEEIRTTAKHLSSQEENLSREQEALQKLQTKLTVRQTRLHQTQKEQRKLLEALDQNIQTKNEELATFRSDRARLRALLKKLGQTPSKLPPSSYRISLEGQRLDSPLKHLPKETKPLNQGLVFLAKEGTPVLSVLPGKVVFSDWLKGYGLLLIIDHGAGVMSLYAHNASLFASLGTLVKQGEQIATVGHTGGLRENGLYFEVRRRGRALPPREWMS